MEIPADINWQDTAETKINLRRAVTKLRQIQQEAAELRNQHISTRASIVNIAKKSSFEKIILNIQKIEHIIKMWKRIKYITSNEKKSYIQTINIPCDETIKWNDIKKAKQLRFKTIDDSDVIERPIAERNSKLLVQDKGYPFTDKSLATQIGKYSISSFSEEILKETSNFSTLNLTPKIEIHLKSYNVTKQ